MSEGRRRAAGGRLTAPEQTSICCRSRVGETPADCRNLKNCACHNRSPFIEYRPNRFSSPTETHSPACCGRSFETPAREARVSSLLRFHWTERLRLQLIPRPLLRHFVIIEIK